MLLSPSLSLSYTRTVTQLTKRKEKYWGHLYNQTLSISLYLFFQFSLNIHLQFSKKIYNHTLASSSDVRVSLETRTAIAPVPKTNIIASAILTKTAVRGLVHLSVFARVVPHHPIKHEGHRFASVQEINSLEIQRGEDEPIPFGEEGVTAWIDVPPIGVVFDTSEIDVDTLEASKEFGLAGAVDPTGLFLAVCRAAIEVGAEGAGYAGHGVASDDYYFVAGSGE